MSCVTAFVNLRYGVGTSMDANTVTVMRQAAAEAIAVAVTAHIRRHGSAARATPRTTRANAATAKGWSSVRGGNVRGTLSVRDGSPIICLLPQLSAATSTA